MGVSNYKEFNRIFGENMAKTETVKTVDTLPEINLLRKLIAQWKTCPVGRFTSMQIILYAVLEYLEFDPERVYVIRDREYLMGHSIAWIINVFIT